MLERFGFTGDRLTARIGDLSGGERRRLQLLRLLLGEPNVLLLDEPTNDLDIETLNVVEDFLDTLAGNARRRLPRPVLPGAGHRLVVRRCSATAPSALLPGGVDEYLSRRAEAALHRRTPDRSRRRVLAQPSRRRPAMQAAASE